MIGNFSSIFLKKVGNLWLSSIWILSAAVLCLLNTHGQFNAAVAWLIILISAHSFLKSRRNI